MHIGTFSIRLLILAIFQFVAYWNFCVKPWRYVLLEIIQIIHWINSLKCKFVISLWIRSVKKFFLYSLISFYLEAVKLRCKKRSTNYIRQNLLQIYYLFIISVFVVLLKRFYFFCKFAIQKVWNVKKLILIIFKNKLFHVIYSLS